MNKQYSKQPKEDHRSAFGSYRSSLNMSSWRPSAATGNSEFVRRTILNRRYVSIATINYLPGAIEPSKGETPASTQTLARTP